MKVPNFQEEHSTKIPALTLLTNLGYEFIPPEQCLVWRGKLSSVILPNVLRNVLKQKTYSFMGKEHVLSEDGIDKIIQELANPAMNEGLKVANEKLYNAMTYGISVTEFIDGNKVTPTIQIIDWDDASNNQYNFTEEMEVQNTHGTGKRIPDIVCFVNGLPWVVIEAKRPDSSHEGKPTVSEGISQNIRNQKVDEIPHLFAYSQILLSINGYEGLYGTCGTPEKFWAKWKEEQITDETFFRLKNAPLPQNKFDLLFNHRPVKVRDEYLALLAGGDAGMRRHIVHTDAAQVAAKPVGAPMTGMNVWKRATLAIVRKPVRSGIIGLLMLTVFTSLVAQVGVSTALQNMSDDIARSMGIGFTVDTGENPASLKEASRFSRIPGVGKTVYERKTLAGVDGAHPVVPEHGPRLDSGLSTQVSVLGTTDSSLSEEFQSGLYRLEQGHHISGNGRNVLIHRDFARENGLSVGSTLRLSQEDRDSTVRVAGIFSGNVQAQSPMPSDASENLIYAGAQVVSALTGEERVGTIRCLSDNPRDLSAAMAQAKKIAGSEYGVTDDSARLSGVLQSVETVRDLVRMVLLSVCLADVLVLGMALVFWIRSRIHEIGTLLALGIGKMRIVAQLAIETGLMAAVAALCSLGTGAMLSGYVSSRLLRDSGVAPLESLHVEALPPEQTMLILLLGCAVIAVALAVSCAAVLSKSPKSILSSMR